MERNIIFPGTVAEIRLSYSSKVKPGERPTITCSADVVDVMRIKWKKNRGFIEEFKVLLLTRSNQVIGMVSISQGGISGTVADPKLIFAAARLCTNTHGLSRLNSLICIFIK